MNDEPPRFYSICDNAQSAYQLMVSSHPNELDEYGYRPSYGNLFGYGRNIQSDFVEPVFDKYDFWSKWYDVDEAFGVFMTDMVHAGMREEILRRAQVDKYGTVELCDPEDKDKVLATVPKLPLI